MNSLLRMTCIVTIGLPLAIAAQSASVPKKSNDKSAKPEKVVPAGHLVPIETVTSASETATSFGTPLTCDDDGNVYLQSDDFGASGIRKINPKGERVALFQPTGDADLKVAGIGYFALDPDDDLYEIAFSKTEVARYVMVYKSDGQYKSTIKLQPGFAITPSQLAVFPSGGLLVSGLKYDKDKTKAMLPFTGIFSSSGVLLKELSLEDDDALHDMATAGDSRVASSTNPQANHAIEFGRMEMADDGNAYLMRWTAPTIFYVISPGGSVERRFVVDPGDAAFHPFDVHIAGGRIAVLYFQPQTKEKRMVIVDLEGHEIAKYDELYENGKRKYTEIGLAFACYTENPQQFTFLGTGDGDKLQITTAEAR